MTSATEPCKGFQPAFPHHRRGCGRDLCLPRRAVGPGCRQRRAGQGLPHHGAQRRPLLRRLRGEQAARGPRQVPCHHRHRPGDGPALQRGRRRVLALECVGALQVLGRRRQPELGRLCEPVQVGQPDPARRLVLFGGRWRPHRRRRLWPAVAPAGPDGRLAVGRGHPGARARARTPWSPSTSTWPASAPTATCSSRAVAAVAATTASS